MSNNSSAILSPDDVVSQLEQAQCATTCSAAKILRDIAPRLSQSHPSVTEAALILLEIHPHETIPHIPDLISNNPDDTTKALQSFSSLLQSDRTLLVPIIATLPDLYLTPAHILHARSTLSFALSVVEEPDLPAVVRALIRSADSPSSADWACRAIRTGLSRSTLQPTIAPLIAHVLHDALPTSSSRVLRALRSHAGSPFLWPDLLIWILSFSPNLSSPVPEREARSSLRTAISNTGLLCNVPRIRAHVRLAAAAFADNPTAVHRFVIAVVTECPSRLADVVGCVHLLRDCILACPTFVVDAIASDLACDTSPVSSIILRALLASGVPLPQLRGALVQCVTLYCESDTRTSSANTLDTAAWNPIFIKIRKGLVFGNEEQRTVAVQLAADVVRNALLPVVREALSLMHDCVGKSLAEDAAIDLLAALKDGILRGMVSESFVETVFKTRIISQSPSGCYDEEPDNDGRSIGILDAMSIKIDVGLIWNQAPATAAIVTSTAVLCFAFRRAGHCLQKLSFNVLNVVVLVPVVCVLLYEAIDHIKKNSNGITWNFNRYVNRRNNASLDDLKLLDELLEMETHDLGKAVSAFGVGIAAIIGIINTACKSLDRCKRIIDRRSVSGNDFNETADHKATWALLERLTELHRMLNALTLGHEVLLRKNGGGGGNGGNGVNSNKSRNQSRSKRRKASNAQSSIIQPNKKIFSANDALLRADAVVSNVTAVLFGCDPPPQSADRQAEYIRHRFPAIRLESIIAMLAAVPDESEMYEIFEPSTRDRDVELVQMDKFLLRLLLRSMREACGSDTKRNNSRLVTEEVQLDIDQQNHQDGDQGCVNNLIQKKGKKITSLTANDVDDLLGQFGKLLDENVNIFNTGDNHEAIDDLESLEKSDACDVRWGVGYMSSKDTMMEYLNDSIAALSEEDEDIVHSTDILHSPTFAALLLDRAATSATVSRNARSQTICEEDIKNLVEVSGISLSCLSLILRELPTFYERFLIDNNDQNSSSLHDPWEGMRQFVETMNANVLTRLPDGFENDTRCTRIESDDFNRFSRVFHTLEWIRVTTPDSVVSIVATDVIMTLSELDVFPISGARKAVFFSLSTIYEFDGGTLWDRDDLSLVLDNPVQDWLVRRRGRTHFADVSNLEVDIFDSADVPPWIEVKKRSGKRDVIEHHRLAMYFGGMHVTHAVLEGCAWVREFSQVASATTSRLNKGSNQLSSLSKGRRKNRLPASSEQFDKDIGKKGFQTCDVLLDMIGLRTIVFTLLQLVLQGLQAYPVDESLPAEKAHDNLHSPLYPLGVSLRLLNGIQELYQRNHEALISSKNKGGSVAAQDLRVDQVFEGEVISGYISSLQQVYRRMEELNQWYSNESVEVSQLDDKSIQHLHYIIGGAIITVANSIQLIETIRETQIQFSTATAAAPDGQTDGRGGDDTGSTSRKKPGYAKKRKGKISNGGGGEKVSHDGAEDYASRSFRLLPRLASLCEQVRKSAERLARCMGVKNNVKLGSLAQSSVATDKELHFGIGIEANGVIGDDDEHEQNEHGDDSEDEFVDPIPKSFHARGAVVENKNNTKTISVRIRHDDQD